MSVWGNLTAIVNSAETGLCGDAATFQQSADGSSPITVTVVRQTRDQSEQFASYERVWGVFGVAAGQFPVVPAKGDFLTIGATGYVVFLAKPDEDPTSAGWRLYLAKRNPNHA